MGRRPAGHAAVRSGARGFTVHLRLVGGFAATQEDRDIRLPAASLRLLAATALHAGPMPRHIAAERLWPHLDPRSAQSSLRTALFRLNSSSALLATGPGYIALADDLEVDVLLGSADHLASAAVIRPSGTTAGTGATYSGRHAP